MYSFSGNSAASAQFPHSCVYERFIQSQDRSTYFLQQNRQTDPGNILIAHRRMNVEIRTETPIFLFWEYLFQNFSILSLQCGGGIASSSDNKKACSVLLYLSLFHMGGRYPAECTV